MADRRSITLVWAAWLAMPAPAQVALSSRAMKSAMVAPGAVVSVPVVADPSPGGEDLIGVLAFQSGISIVLVTPAGVEITAETAEAHGYRYETFAGSKALDAVLPNPLSLPGQHTLIRFPAGAAPGEYTVRLRAAAEAKESAVLVSYYSSSAVRAGVAAGKTYCQAGEPLAVTGFVFDGDKPVSGAKASMRYYDPDDLSRPPQTAAMSDEGPNRIETGEGVYLGIIRPERAGRLAISMQIEGKSLAGAAFVRTATTEIVVVTPTARFVAFADAAVDDNGDGVLDRIAVTAQLNAAVPGPYEWSMTLAEGGNAVRASATLDLVEGEQSAVLTIPLAGLAAFTRDGPYEWRDALLMANPGPTATVADHWETAGLSSPYALAALAAAQPGVLTVEPSTLEFGTVALNATKDLTLTIRNTSDFAITENVLPAAAAGFAVAGPEAPFTLAPRSSQTLTVRWTAAPGGAAEATLTIAGVTVTCRGTASATLPNAAVSPAALDFGTVAAGASLARTISVSNAGPGVLTVASLAASGGAWSAPSPATPFTVAAGGSREVTVRFAPAAAGAASGTLTITTDDPAHPRLTVALTGLGGPAAPDATPKLQLAPQQLDFGSIPAGTSAERTVDLANAGTGPLTVSALTSSSAAFTTPAATLPFSVAAGASTPVRVRFAPAAAGNYAGILTLTSNDPAQPSAAIAMAGAATPAAPGGAPKLQVTPQAIDFGTIKAGGSVERSVSLTNAGTAPLIVSGILSSAPVFTAAGAGLPLTVAAGATAALTIRFAPVTSGSYAGIVTITSNDAALPSVAVALAGVAEAGGGSTGGALIDVTPAALHFGPVLTSTAKNLTLMVSGARGTASLHVAQLAIDNPAFTVVSPVTPFTVTFQTPVVVRFQHASAGPQTGTLTITSDAGDFPQLKVALTAAAVSPGEYTVGIDDGEFETSVGIQEAGASPRYLQRITPVAWPATLKAVRVFVPAGAAGTPYLTSLVLVSGAIEGPLRTMDDVILRTSLPTVRSQGQWVELPVSPLTIASGDFLVGISLPALPGRTPILLDTTVPAGRSFVNVTDSAITPVAAALEVDGNFALRIVVSAGN